MPTFTFTVNIQGKGRTEEEAYEDAIDTFADNPCGYEDMFEHEDTEDDTLFSDNDSDTEDWDSQSGRPAHMRDEDWD